MTDEQQILEMSAQWAAAMVANDADAIGAFMADEWTMVSERGISGKEHFLAFVRSGALTHSSLDLVGEPRISIYGDVAIVACRATNTRISAVSSLMRTSGPPTCSLNGTGAGSACTAISPA